jgi:hypothetical protein
MARYAFPVWLFHPRLQAGLSRRTQQTASRAEQVQNCKKLLDYAANLMKRQPDSVLLDEQLVIDDKLV